jgi:quinol monooxygenase YgiN
LNKEGRKAQFKALAAALVAEPRREAGCLAYDLWRWVEAHEYVFIERCVDKATAGVAAALMSSFS